MKYTQTPETDMNTNTENTNTENKSGENIRAVFYILIGITVIVLIGGIMYYYGRTSVEWALPLAVGLFLSALTLKPMLSFWKWLLESGPYFAGIVHLAAMAIVFAFLFLGINFWMADDTTLHEERVELIDRGREKRYHSRRVGRHRYVKGNAYYVYHMTVRLPDGREKRLDVPLSYYNTLARKDSVTLILESGGLGMPVIRQK